jgi:uncharacterized protein YgiM (DUF1202 family)
MKNHPFKLWRAAMAFAALLATGLGVQAQTVQVSVDTELRASPALDARVLSKLTPGTTAQQTGSQGAWVKVKVRNQEGWVRLTHVKPQAAPAQAQASNPLTGLAGAFSASSTRPTQTTAVRGLETGQIANAQPAPEEVQLLERYAVTSAQAEQHAKAGRLTAQRIEPYSGADQ